MLRRSTQNLLVQLTKLESGALDSDIYAATACFVVDGIFLTKPVINARHRRQRQAAVTHVHACTPMKHHLAKL